MSSPMQDQLSVKSCQSNTYKLPKLHDFVPLDTLLTLIFMILQVYFATLTFNHVVLLSHFYLRDMLFTIIVRIIHIFSIFVKATSFCT